MVHQDDARVDDLRKQLKALGYLDAGVDRFVLGPARSARRPSVIAALASLRVGVVAAALLGPAVAIGIGTRLPGLVTGARDAAIVALYLAIMFGFAATVFTFVASVLVARLATRAHIVSRAAGTLVGIGCLVYLTLWWRSANAEFAWAAPTWTALALVLAVIISLLLGHVVAITTFAVMAAQRAPQSGGLVTERSSTRWLVVAAGVLAFVGAAGLLFLASPAAPEAVDRPQLAVVFPGAKVRVIAIDGFDPDVYESLRAAGRIPTLARMLAGGRVRVPADETRDPARAWTTIATGQPAAMHGVQSLETRRVAGLQGSVASGEERGLGGAIRGATDLLRLTRPSVATGAELRVKTFWEVAADAGLRAVVVNWWATWPATAAGPDAPVVLSDRATLRLEHGGVLDAEIAPKELYDRLRTEWTEIKRQAAATVAALLPAGGDAAIVATLRRSAELDALQLALMRRVEGDTSDLIAVYLPGLDIAQHTLLAQGAGEAPSAISARIDALRTYYELLDSLLKDARRPAADELLFLATQPGRLSAKAGGIVGISGRLASGPADGDARGVDIAPTVLYALGVPISRQLAGKPQVQLFTPEFVSRFPVREVPTYGPRVSRYTAREGTPLDEEMVERLRSLGYVR